jgi:hypothetical protein
LAVNENDAPTRDSRLAMITNTILSGSATIIAVVALATGIYQAKLSRDQADASVWPYVLQGNSGNNGYSRMIQNVGIGPAKIGAFEVRVGGVAVHTWQEAAESLHVKLSWRDSRSTTMKAGIVLPPNTVTELLTLPDTNDVKLFRAAMTRASAANRPLVTWVCYCSIYGRCWAGTDEPAPTKACENDPARAFLE